MGEPGLPARPTDSLDRELVEGSPQYDEKLAAEFDELTTELCDAVRTRPERLRRPDEYGRRGRQKQRRGLGDDPPHGPPERLRD